MEKALLEALFGFHFAFAQNPFDTSFRPRYGRSFRGIPVLVMPEASRPQSLKPKMVSIPVHFQVNDIERSVSKTETVELIQNDPKQRLKVNENLMSLLFKLTQSRD
uniref:Uncharacterized protein n=1 Tax=Gossypium raimondii TaxID=29730 RepID=A0A0D2R8J9_GOSRA|nr:hypothetical protein B456_008G034400 [Gossypium raimondii]